MNGKRELRGHGDWKICYVNVIMYKYVNNVIIATIPSGLGVSSGGEWVRGYFMSRLESPISSRQGGSLIKLKRKLSHGGWIGVEVGGSPTISVSLSGRVGRGCERTTANVAPSLLFDQTGDGVDQQNLYTELSSLVKHRGRP